ncbi:MAG: ABC transporter ATP-binding protein [Clostridioides sp.]|jgi:NitT/TauT family transport system ATP-binding protein|nr:ABC transporter ATP-binding protein [Clostridioides sp.]
MNKNIVEVKNLNKTFYNKQGEINVLNDINFSLQEGEILTLLGPSGSGKSTLLNILTNLIKPTSGEIQINAKIGYMFQKDNLLDWRNIYDNITIGLEIQKKKNDIESKNRIDNLLKTYGLWDFRNMHPKELSGGMRQRVALIRTLSVDPDVLLLDEPFSALDYQSRLLVCDDVYKIIKNENKSAILVTHDISEAISISDKVVVLSKRPAKVINVHQININVEGEKSPLKTRNVPKFQTYFNTIWKELQSDEI